jgi:hypothetical protein
MKLQMKKPVAGFISPSSYYEGLIPRATGFFAA